MLASKQLDLVYQRNSLSVWLALLTSGLIVVALWPMVDHKSSLTWMLTLWLVMTVRNFYSRRYLQLGHGAVIDHEKWQTGMVAGAAITGTCWGLGVLSLPASPLDPAFMLLMFILAGVTAFATAMLAAVPLVAMAFLLSAVLPVAFWLLSFGEHLPVLMGVITLVYLGGMLLFARQMHSLIRRLLLTAEKNNELSAEVQESDQRMLRYLESAPGFFFSLRQTPDGQVSMPFASDGLKAIYGLQPEDVAASVAPLVALDHPDDVAKKFSAMEKSGRTLLPCQVEFRVLNKEKGEIWVEARSMPKCDEDGTMHWHGFMHDITERKRMEVVLHESETRSRHNSNLLQSIFESPSKIGIYALDCEYRYLAFNSKFREGAKRLWNADITLGMSMLDSVDNEAHREICRQGYAQVLAGHSFSLETKEAVVKDGVTTYEYHENFGAPIRNDNGEIIGLTIFTTEISARKHMEERLIASEQEFRTLAENFPDVVVRYDRDCRRIYVNSALVALAGSAESAMLGKMPQDASPLIDVEGYMAELRKVMESGDSSNMELPVRRVSGEDGWYMGSFVPERDADGNCVGVMMVARDITERKAIENALNDSESMLQEAQRIAHVGSWDVDMVNDKLIWSDEIFRIWEIDKTKFKADFAAFLATVHPEDRECVSQAFNEAIVSHSLYEVEHRLLFPDGRVKYILERGEPQYDAQDKPVRFIGTSLDITERKLMQDKLAASEREFRTLAENTLDPIYRYDRDCRRIYVNPAVAKITGKPVESFTGGTPSDGAILVSEQSTRLMESIRTVFDSGETRAIMLDFVAQDGEHRDYHMLLIPECDANGQVATVLAMARDVTEMRRLERRQSQFFVVAPGFFYTSVRQPNGQNTMPFASPGIRDLFGLEPADVEQSSEPLLAQIHPDDREQRLGKIEESARNLTRLHYECRINHPQKGVRWIEADSLSQRLPDGSIRWDGVMHDITERKFAEQYEQFRSHTLELLADNNSLPGILEEIVRGVEQLNSKMLCSILLLDSEGKHLVDGIAPSLPDFYNAAINGIAIGMGMGSCGTAAASGERVIVEDIQTHPYWALFKELAARAGLGACWSQPVRSSSGKVLGTFAIYHREAHSPTALDISLIEKVAHMASLAIERKRMQEALAASEREFRTLTDNLPDPVFRYAVDGHRIYVNPAVVRISGVSAETLLAHTPQDAKLVSSNDGSKVLDCIRKVVESRQPLDLEVSHVAKNGELRTYVNRHVPEFGPNGEVVGVLSIGRDITERKRMELALQASEREFRSLAANMPDNVARWDVQGCYLYVNPTHERTLGIAASELIGKPLPDTHEHVKAAIAQVVATGQVVELVRQSVPVGDEIQIHEVSLVPERDAAGHVVSVLGLGRNMTEFYRMQETMEKAHWLLRSVLQGIPDPVWMKDADGAFVVCNQGVVRLFNMKEEEIIGKTDYDFFDAEMAEFYQNKDRAALEAGGICINEEWWTFGDNGEKALMETSKVQVRSPDGKLIGVLGVARDITARKRMESELLESRNFLNRIIDSIPDPIFVKDAAHRWVLSNEAFCKLVGQPREKLLGKSDYDFLPKEQSDVFWEKDEQVFASGVTNLNEESITGGSGETRYLYTQKTPFISGDGQALLVGVIRDITERKQMEEAMRESGEKLSDLYKLSPLGIALTDMQGRYVEFNESFRAICGYPADELMTVDYWMLTPKEYEAGEAEQLESLSKTGRYGPYEKEYRQKDGTRIPIQLNGTLISGKDGQNYIWSIVEDISERKRGEAQLKEKFERIIELNDQLEINARDLEDQAVEFEAQAVELEASQEQIKLTEAWYRGIVRSAPEGMVVVNDAGCISLVNTHLEKMFGYEEGELLGDAIEVLLPPDVRHGHVAQRDGFFAAGVTGRPTDAMVGSLRACRKDGSEFPVEVSLSRLPEFDGRGSSICASVRDITGRRAMEAARENALAEAQRLAQLRSAFMAQMSHELRTPLNGILGYAQNLLHGDALGEKQTAGLRIIQNSGEHLLSIINGILDHAAIEADKFELIPGDIELEAFLSTLIGIIRVRAEQKNLAFTCAADADLPAVVRGDAQRLRQVLLNLLANAVKFTDSGQVTLRVNYSAPSRLHFAVQDSGVGIDADQLETIFLPFEQAGETSRRAGGTGLGLAISRKLVQLMGGDIKAESQSGAGSIFSFEIDMATVQSGVAKVNVAALSEQATTRVVQAAWLHAPSLQELDILHGSALRGNMRDVIKHADKLAGADSRYLPFAEQVRQLARGFQTKALLSLIAQYLNRQEEV